MAAAHLARSHRDLEAARDEAERWAQACQDIADHAAPASAQAIDPWRLMAAQRQWQQCHGKQRDAQQEVQARRLALDDAQRTLRRARIEQEMFTAHHAAALKEHLADQLRRNQTMLDQEWLARVHSYAAADSADSTTGQGSGTP